MSQSMPLLPGSSPESIQLEPFDQSAAGPPPVNPLLKIHKLLAGRYHWAIILGVIFGAIAAASGYLLVPEKYQSSGLIDIKPYLKRIVFPNEQNMVMPMFDSYVSKQIAIMQQQRCIQFAMESGAWTTAGNGKTANRTMLDFADNLGVGKAGELVYVSFVDKDPAVAQAGVKAIINAYQQIAAEKDDEDQRAKQILENRITENTRVMKATQDRIDNITKDYGTDDLTLFYTAWATILNNLDQQIVERQEILALSQGAVILETQPAASQPSDAAQATSQPATTQIAVGPGPTSGPATRPGTGPKKLTPQMIAGTDDIMKGYLNQKKAIEDDIVRLRHSVAENHPSVLKDKAQLAATQELIDSYQATVQKSMDNGEMAVGLDPTSIRENQIQTSRVQLRALTEIRAQAYNRMIGIAQIMRDVRKLQQDVALSRETLEKAKAQSEQNSLESLIGNRLIVYSDGDIPLRPLKNKRLPAIAGGAAGGLGLGFALMALIGFFDRRVKSVADTRLLYDRSNRILGILPSLPDDLTDPDQAATAAFCVHHIRTLLQIGAGGTSHPVIAVTSAAPGEGKTSLVFSLGLSYAATGVKALLIDFDIIGAGLTSRANGIVRRKIGEVLVRNGVISREQLTDALDKTRKSGKRMGETLIESGVLTQDDLDRALDAQRETSLGLLDVLDGEDLAHCLINGDTPNLSILPMGNVGARHVGQVSIREVQRIFREAREKYDVILVDTGPLLGSLEASIVAAMADEVILVVARGQQRPLIDKTFSRLVEVGARVTGIVFNRAAQEDIERSEYSTSYQSMHIQSPVLPRAGTNGKQNRLGPVARAVANSGTQAAPDESAGEDQ